MNADRVDDMSKATKCMAVAHIVEVELRVVPAEVYLDTHEALIETMLDRLLRTTTNCCCQEQ